MNGSSDWRQLKTLIANSNLPDLGPGPRAGCTPEPQLNRALEQFFASAAIPPDLRPSLRSAALLWHDHLDASHAVSQGIHDADGSFLHGIVHRREPDYANAKYWFHRVGKHPCFPNIAERVESFLKTKGERQLLRRLVPSRHWDPCGFIDACEAANDQETSENLRNTLRAIQEIEFDALLAHLFEQA